MEIARLRKWHIWCLQGTQGMVDSWLREVNMTKLSWWASYEELTQLATSFDNSSDSLGRVESMLAETMLADLRARAARVCWFKCTGRTTKKVPLRLSSYGSFLMALVLAGAAYHNNNNNNIHNNSKSSNKHTKNTNATNALPQLASVPGDLFLLGSWKGEPQKEFPTMR